MIKHAASVVGDNDAVASRTLGGQRVFRRHEPLKQEFHPFTVHPLHDAAQFLPGFGRHGAAHAGQRDQARRVKVHAEDARPRGRRLDNLGLQFLAVPRLDERNPPTAFGGDGGISCLMEFVGSPVAHAANDPGLAAAGNHGGRIRGFVEKAPHVEGRPRDGRGQHGQTQRHPQNGGFRIRPLDLMNEAHIPLHVGKGLDVVAEGSAAPDAAHAGRLSGAGAATGQTLQYPFMRSRARARSSCISIDKTLQIKEAYG